MATSLQLYKKSTFPPLLNIYQPPHCRNEDAQDESMGESLPSTCCNEDTMNDKNPKKMMKDDNGKKRNNKSSFSDEDQEDAMKLALLEQCIPGHQVPYCKLSHDAKYLKSIPQSSNYLVIGLQNELTRRGILKNQQDYEDFWTLILEGTHGSRLKEKLQDIKFKMVAAKSFPSHPVVRTGAAQSANVLLNNRCGQLKTSSASLPGSVSCQPPAHHPSKLTKAQEETEQIFPKLLLSWLSELQKRPEEQSRTQEVSKPCKRTRKHFHQERHLIYLHHMYHLALLNMTSSKRLLEKNGQFAVAEKEHSVHDLMEYLFPSHHKQPGNSSTERGIEESTFPILLDRKQHEQCHRGFSKTRIVFKEMKNNSKEKQHENKGAVEILEDQKYNNSAFAPHEMITVPLTMEDVVLNNPVVEAKSTVTYWTNYVDKD
ncbi:uncharacterized protein LOC117874772 isoform X4 [Trachemys scripta elegans]|uniref:uncharacterized protein LOC117874772 isoform X4 n=1 Tax=Trachemys scripta elegans TaxID=31138 RepID=UPI00155189E9|nr:uncharacterized protein LOC117874772 isoform X4 [Trachemys scripta elegans]